MAEVLNFENESLEEINEIFFKRSVRGIPSQLAEFYLRNQSENRTFQGTLNIAPSFGKSYSEDAFVSSSGQSWSKHVTFELPPQSRQGFKARITPITTPGGFSGKASVTITGDWI